MTDFNLTCPYFADKTALFEIRPIRFADEPIPLSLEETPVAEEKVSKICSLSELFATDSPKLLKKKRQFLNTKLRTGYRLQPPYIYKRKCTDCNLCQSLRLPVNTFRLSTSLKRIVRRNKDLLATLSINATAEDLKLQKKYLHKRHNDHSNWMRETTELDFVYRLSLPPAKKSKSKTYASVGKTIGWVSATWLSDGIDARISCYDLDSIYANRSLGILLILKLIDFAQMNDLQYLYLGMWVQGYAKTMYKKRFLPWEAYDYITKRWETQTQPSNSVPLKGLNTPK